MLGIPRRAAPCHTVAKREKELEGAKGHISALNTAKAENEEAEDPEIVAERKRRFERAEAFEREKERRLAGRRSSAPAYIPEDDEAPQQSSDGKVTVTMDAGAFDIVRKLAMALPLSTPPEHVMCGYGGIKISVGTIRAIAGVRMR